jgi:glycerol dehydrogenase
MLSITAFPGRYIQGKNALATAGEYVKALGKNVLIIGGQTALEVARGILEFSLKENEISSEVYIARGHCSDNSINDILHFAANKNYDVIIGVGGGRVIDIAKSVAFNMKLPMVIIPTTAANDAAPSSSTGIYDDEGKFVRTLFMNRNPELIIADSEIIAKAPLRLFLAGMGDAIATWYEADACQKANVKNRFNGRAGITAMSIALICKETIFKYGYEAVCAVKENSVTPAFENVVEANILMSCIGFENGGLSIAHALQGGMTVLEEIKEYYHGEKVGFFTLVQMVLEGRDPSEISELINFYKKVGLPVTLADLGLGNVSDVRILGAIKNTFERMPIVQNIQPKVDENDILYALKVTDALGK